MYKNGSKISWLLAAALLLCSCGTKTPEQQAAESAQSSAASSFEQIVSEKAEELKEEARTETEHDIIINSSLLSVGNNERFRKVLEKAGNGEEITVGYIGGSITEGYTVKPEECWAYLTYRWLCEKYPDAKINYVNAGLSGTPSSLAVVRCERDLLSPCGDPDIVFIEFAVNDAQNDICKESYESLVRRIYDLDSDPAVALLFMRTDNGYSCQAQQSEIGYKYGLPMVSINDALTTAFDNGIMQWSDYSDDGAHPNPDGCRLIAEMIENMYERLLEDFRDGNDPAPEILHAADVVPIYGDSYINMHMIDNKSLTPISSGEYKEGTNIAAFPDGWYRKGGDNTGFSFEADFGSLFIVYQCDNKPRFGTAEVYIDGEWASEVKSSASDGWNNPVPQLVKKFGETGHHTVEIKMKEGNEDTYFGILAFGITDNSY